MIIVDTALQQRSVEGRPVRVAISGAGWMGRHITRQVGLMDGLEVVGVVNRTLAKAVANLELAGRNHVEHVDSLDSASAAIAAGNAVVTDDPRALCGAEGVDVVIETTGEIAFGAEVAVSAIEAGKHVVLDNAELDATVGPILKVMADQSGVVLTGIDGDEPAVAMNLVRFVRTVGLRPVLVGNIKGFMDHKRNPETQKAFAAQHGQDPAKVASFADGTKLAAECTVLANATGFGVATPGMNGFRLEDVSEVIGQFDPDELLERPLVDFVLGAKPGSGVFVVGHEPDTDRRSAMEYLKMGPGPLHLFTRPFHLPHLETPLSAARAALFGDAAVTPLGGPVCDAVAYAKRDLEAGEVMDGLGGFAAYAMVHNAGEAAESGLLPIGLTPGAVVKRSVPEDRPLTYDDVEIPETIARDLRAKQDAHTF